MLVQNRKVLSDSWFQTFALNTYEIIVISFHYHCFWQWNNFRDVVTNRSEFRSPHSPANHFLNSQISIRDMPIARPVYCVGSCSKWDHTWGGAVEVGVTFFSKEINVSSYIFPKNDQWGTKPLFLFWQWQIVRKRLKCMVMQITQQTCICLGKKECLTSAVLLSRSFQEHGTVLTYLLS